MKNFNALKAKGLSDEEAIKQAYGLTAKGRAKLKKADVSSRKQLTLRRKARMAVTKDAGSGHSPAGKKELRRRKAK